LAFLASLPPFGGKPSPSPFKGLSGGLLVGTFGGSLYQKQKQNIKLSEKKFASTNFFCF
jgi:hypothetical protein